jgi:hypothetical protein
MIDQIGHPETPFLRGGAAVLLAMQFFLMFVIRYQLAKIRRHQRGFVRLPSRLGRRERVCVMLAMQKTSLDPGDGIGQSPAFRAAVVIRLPLSLGEGPDEIGTADDADDPAITQHRNPLDAVRG